MNNESNVQNQVNDNAYQNDVNNINQVSVQNNPSVPVSSEIVNPVSNNSDIPAPASVENVIPTASGEQEIIDDSKKKKGGGFIILFIMVLLILSVVYMDEITAYVKENILDIPPAVDVPDPDSDNLISGYVLIDDSTASIKVNSIKFYNFKKNGTDKSIIMSYVSDKGIKVVSDENMYVEFYDADKVLLHKELFNVEDGISMGIIKTYNVLVSSDIFDNISYALVRKLNDEELSKSSSLVCKYEKINENYSENYSHEFNFINDMLVSYNVNMSVSVISTLSDDVSDKAISNLKSEYDKVISANLSALYNDGNLTYFIDLNTIGTNYIPLYNKGVTIGTVKNREIFKKWICE